MPAMPAMFDTVIIGAGPHGLAVLLHLLEADPRQRDRVVVIDPAGTWLTRWNDSFARLDIAALRSPGVHHPGPRPAGLSNYVADQGLPDSGLGYNIPRTEVFADYCNHLVASNGLVESVIRGHVRALRPGTSGMRITIDDATLTASRVVMATNPHYRVIPEWVYGALPLPVGRIEHADQIDLRGRDLAGETIAVVGGGLTAAHLAVGAVRRGAHVELLSRRPLLQRMFDVEPGWFGPKHLAAYQATADPTQRLMQARRARHGGSVPPWMHAELKTIERTGALCVRTSTVERARPHGNRIELEVHEGRRIVADRVWLATGTVASVDACGALRAVRADIADVDGFPVPDRDLRIGPWPIHVTGRLATLVLGPAAGNIWGARLAAVAIARAVTGVDLDAERGTVIDQRSSRGTPTRQSRS